MCWQIYSVNHVYLWFRHYKYEQKLSSLFWKIDYKDLGTADMDGLDTTLSDKLKVKIGNVKFDISHSANIVPLLL